MKNIFLILILSCVLFSCGDNNTPAPPAAIPPLLVSSAPQNNAQNIPAGNIVISLTFDQNVICPSEGQPTITLSGGANITKISYNSATPVISIYAENLEYDKTFQLVVPKGGIKSTGKIDAEAVSLTFSTEKKPESNISPNLCTENPSAEAVELYNYLKSIYGQKTLSGAVARVAWNTDEAERVNRWTGKFPKINTFDYIHLWASPANWIDYGNISVVENWHNAGGIVGAMWHWNVPKSETSAATDLTYRPEETTFHPANALVEGTWENAVMKADLEKTANYLLLLKNKNIPVLWRPLHEAAGNTYAVGYQGTAWFWWGRDGAEPFKNLWKYMFNYFKQKGLNNLIWVWTTEANDVPFYPGDEFVDIVGRDMYNVAGATAAAAQFRQIQAMFPHKMITLAECGGVANIGEQWAAGAKWLWFMPWYDFDANDADSPPNIYATKTWWQAAATNQNVVMR
ncbi:hypothetical protein FACS1894180_3280 [Bacteroidia bacterium]|nr:hypothetical protein FACS1894180_3280 [Bacteroidia bacterium]